MHVKSNADNFDWFCESLLSALSLAGGVHVHNVLFRGNEQANLPCGQYAHVVLPKVGRIMNCHPRFVLHTCSLPRVVPVKLYDEYKLCLPRVECASLGFYTRWYDYYSSGWKFKPDRDISSVLQKMMNYTFYKLYNDSH